MPLHVEIVTPTRKAFEGTASEVQIPGWLGEMGVLPSHTALLTLTHAGVVTLQGVEGQLTVGREPVALTAAHQGQACRLVLGAGFAEVGADRVTLVVELCEDGAGVDRAAAAAALSSAEAEMVKHDGGSLAFRLAQKAADLARARLSV